MKKELIKKQEKGIKKIDKDKLTGVLPNMLLSALIESIFTYVATYSVDHSPIRGIMSGRLSSDESRNSKYTICLH
jgi:hypothetical protein